ncbi:hypothetical protein HII36_34340 [Nonomuraea sp. NN258]|uniref:hypothetical protein n=1 Tax=Nonomuraea antri TaxID=2730852 RepID=UPI00156A2CC5|nr:hypothetical protein [Nonomuraea antri]NRQ36882.1 hypothetical protein [Nonomuraea antri]
MEPADGRVILFIIIGIALFAAGRRFQTMLLTRRVWRDTARTVTVRKEVAKSAFKAMIGMALIAVFVIWVALNLNRVM